MSEGRRGVGSVVAAVLIIALFTTGVAAFMLYERSSTHSESEAFSSSSTMSTSSVSSSTNYIFAQSTRDTVDVTFYQIGACSPPVYTTPWVVKLTGTTRGGLSVNESQELPPGADLSIYDGGGYQASTAGANMSTMVFQSVPVGDYGYDVTPHGAFYNPTGSFTVDGSANLIIALEGPVVSCAITTTKSG